MSYTFQAPCGCLMSMDGGLNEPCPIHQVEGVTPKEAMAVFLRRVLLDETEEAALAAIRAAHPPEAT